jgi:2-polyprenyl-3-methyl-5-hydroxy-6-metoxy-1,4-benzoquinol methylase
MEPLAERLFRDTIGAFEIFAVYVGERLGLYTLLAEHGPMTAPTLAGRAGIDERYAREWLEQQVASGNLTVHGEGDGPTERRFALPPEHVPVLADRDDLRYEAHRGVEAARVARELPGLVEAFRTGDAPKPIPWGPDGRAEYNRALFMNLLGTRWLPSIAEVHERLGSAPPAAVADIACGTGWSSIAMALAYPTIRVLGADLDEQAIAVARRNAADAGVADRVVFEVVDAARLASSGLYDLVTIFEALHDMVYPVDVLRSARAMLGSGGSVVIADERVSETLTAPASDRERYVYALSVLTCMPPAMGHPGSPITGAVIKPSIVRRYAEEAGFGEVAELPIESDFWRFYRLTA